MSAPSFHVALRGKVIPPRQVDGEDVCDRCRQLHTGTQVSLNEAEAAAQRKRGTLRGQAQSILCPLLRSGESTAHSNLI